MKASEVLRSAKARIGTPEKWGKGDTVRERGLLCAGLAINNSCEWQINEARAGSFFMKAVRADSVPEWNDRPETTHAEVMAAFDRAIALAEADERKDKPWTMEDTREVIAGIVSTTPELGTVRDESEVG